MAAFVKPKVYLIAETMINEDNVFAWLSDLGGESCLAHIDGEDKGKLIELCGRRCYKSFTPGLNPNVTRIRTDSHDYLENIKKSRHGSVMEHASLTFAVENCSRVFCYGEDTEILTINGWKHLKDIRDNEVLLTKNPESGMCRFSKNKKMHEFDYNGEMHWFESSQWKSPLFTDHHIQWCQKYDLRKFRGKKTKEISNCLEKIPYEKIRDKRIVIDHKINMDYIQDEDKITIGDYSYKLETFMFWLGIIATDGGVSNSKNAINIYQTKIRNLSKVRKVMDDLFGNRWKEYPGNFRIFDADLKKWVIKYIGRTNSARSLYRLLEFSDNSLENFYKGALLGDGNIHKTNEHEVLYCGTFNVAKDYQSILARLGKSSNIRIDNRVGSKHTLKSGQVIENKEIQYIVSVHRKGESLIKKYHHKHQYMDCKVYCPETDDGLVYVRNSGMAFWSGNTHELVRHRAGTAFAQESLRYVRLTDLNMYFPEIFSAFGTDKESAALKLAHEYMVYSENTQKALAEIFKDELDGNFHVKKKLTSAFRRFAPIGLATGIIFTANIRALRHLIEMRTDDSAEEEIRLIFGQVADIAKEKMPYLFDDYKETEVDGFTKYETEYRKA